MELRIEIGGGSGLNRRPLRSEVPVEETWRLEDLFGSDEEWEAALKSLDAGIPAVAQYMGRLKDGPRLMAECFEAAENLIRRAAPVGSTLTSVLRKTVQSGPIKHDGPFSGDAGPDRGSG